MVRRPPPSTLFPYTTALPISVARVGWRILASVGGRRRGRRARVGCVEIIQADQDRKSTRLNSSHANISYAVFCLKKKKNGGSGRHRRRHPESTPEPSRALDDA